MMGLLDQFSEFAKTPEGQGLLSAAFGGLAGARRGEPVNSLGRAGLAGMAGYSGAMDRQQQAAESQQNQQYRGMQMDAMKAQQAQAAEKLKREQAQMDWLKSQDPRLMATGGNMAPTPENAQKMGQVDPYKQKLWEFASQGLIPVSEYVNSMKPKAPEMKVVGDTLLSISEEGAKPVWAKPEKVNPNQPFMVVDGKIVPNEAYQRYEMDKAATGATRVNQSVNTGQKGFDNTLKLRGDFRSEPIYKAHQEMTSAYSQIKQALGKASPAGDLAGATKIMKLLDPGSVVRESELGMAMAATGALDRLENYASNIINGTKLTPKQREDFQSLADALYSESVNQYNGKRQEYQGIAERNELNTMDVLGPEGQTPEKPAAKPAKTVVRRGVYGGRKVIQYSDGSTEYAD